jgi:Kip1 ubiquitination-promoting complex protein 1
MTHVNHIEIEKVKKLIEVLQMRQSLLSDTTLISEDALCPICYAQQNGESNKPKSIQICSSLVDFQTSFSSPASTSRVTPASSNIS